MHIVLRRETFGVPIPSYAKDADIPKVIRGKNTLFPGSGNIPAQGRDKAELVETGLIMVYSSGCSVLIQKATLPRPVPV